MSVISFKSPHPFQTTYKLVCNGSSPEKQWYLRYQSEVADGNLELPEYDLNENGCIILYYGEVFCRVPDCAKATHKFSSTSNLHTHIKSHGAGFKIEEGNTGGRIAQKIIDHGVQWYKSLFSGTERVTTTPSSGTPSSHAASTVDSLPILPKKKDGTVHITNMRLEVVRLGKPVPCRSCATRNACCKDINKCEYFVLFDCGDLRPDAAVSQGDNEANEAVA